MVLILHKCQNMRPISKGAFLEFITPLWFDSLGSTNTTLAQQVREGAACPGTVIAAREQTAGRGRYDRKWVSAAGSNLMFSFYLRTRRGFPDIASVPVAAALGVTEYLRKIHGLTALGKWPNDVMIDGCKICGILSERIANAPEGSSGDPSTAGRPAGEGNHIVVGIGINLNMTADEAMAVPKPATSVRIAAGRQTHPEEELPVLLRHLCFWLTRWEEGGFPALREQWTSWAWQLGKEVTVGDGAYRQTGILHGFGESGELLLRLPDGALRPCWAGDFEY